MLVSLAIRDIVLIDRLDLDFHDGLCVLTGETGAGKSILLDALGLALGARGDAALVRGGGDGARAHASVAAAFTIAAPHPALALLDQHGIDRPPPGDALILRRTLTADGRSRAFVNDQPVGVTLLRALGETVVEIEGQFASQGLLETANHRATLDAFGRLDGQRDAVAAAFRAMHEAAAALDEARAGRTRSRADEDYLRHAWAELEGLDAQPGEEAELASERALLMNREKLVEALNAALAAMTEGDGVEARIGTAHRVLARSAGLAAGRLDEAVAALERALAETADAAALLERAAADLDADPARLEGLEERLFALRAVARKHDREVEALPALKHELALRLAAIDDSGDRLAALDRAAAVARQRFVAEAGALSEARVRAAAGLDARVAAELPPLRLEKAGFRTIVEAAGEGGWGEHGIDRVAFEIATNPGQAPGPLARIASGGELARFMLAIKVALRDTGAATSLVFDEVDAGIGGATASAVGARLRALGDKVQVLVITHSPQVAARGTAHWRVRKREAGGRGARRTVTVVEELNPEERREEIARMLAGARITDAARAAADSLIAGGAA